MLHMQQDLLQKGTPHETCSRSYKGAAIRMLCLWQSLLSKVSCGQSSAVHSNKLTGYSDVLRRHARSHSDQVTSKGTIPEAPAFDSSNPESTILTPVSAAGSLQLVPGITSVSTVDPNANSSSNPQSSGLAQPNIISYIPPVYDDTSPEPRALSESATWFLEDDFDVCALEFSITSTISEWAQLPNIFPNPSLPPTEQGPFGSTQSSVSESDTPYPGEDTVKRKWFTHMLPSMEKQPSRDFTGTAASWQNQTNGNESYRVGLSQKLRPRMEDEALPSSEHLNLFAKLYFIDSIHFCR